MRHGEGSLTHRGQLNQSQAAGRLSGPLPAQPASPPHTLLGAWPEGTPVFSNEARVALLHILRLARSITFFSLNQINLLLQVPAQ